MTAPFGVTADRLSHDPHPILAEVRSSSPVCWIPDLSCWLVTGYRHAVEVMRDPATFTVDHPGFSTQQVIGPSMLSLDGAAHRLHRDPFTAPFRLRVVRSNVAGWIEDRADELVSAVERDGHADLRRTVARPLAVDTMAHILGLEGVSPSDLVSWYEAIVGAVDAVTMGSVTTEEGREAFAELTESVVASMETSPLLRSVRAGGHLTVDQIASNVAVLLFGGIVTGDGTNSLAIDYLLAEGLVGGIRGDPNLVSAFVEEILRLEPAAAAVDRFATCDVEFEGAKISSGDLVRVSLSAANRDPEIFDEPDRLRLDRRNAGKHLSFARGPHSCLGIHVAKAEASAVVRAISRRLDNPVLEDHVDPRGLIFRELERVPARWNL